MKIFESNALVLGLAFLVLGTMAFNVFLQGEIGKDLQKQELAIAALSSAQGTGISGAQSGSAGQGSGAAAQGSGGNNTLSFEEFIPKGIPAIYGAELGVSFDKPLDSLNVLSALDGDLYEDGVIKFSDLSAEQQQNYIKIGMSIACEYCCGATSLIAPNGQPACGCAHSAAMRGLAKYLVKYHGSEYSNEQILQELTLWKTMFFPKQMYQKALQLQASGQGSAVPSVIENVPDMVGGC